MKKNLLNLAMALCIGLFASCSQEEIISGNEGGMETVSISAQLPEDAVQTRALPGAAAKHKLRCILEVWDKAPNGQRITRIEKLGDEAASTGGKLQFQFTVSSSTDYECLLWADFIASDAQKSGETYPDKYYDTESLKAIGFKETGAGLFNNESADAFCGVQAKTGNNLLSVTLKRPFTRLTVKDNSEYLAGVKSLAPTLTVPSGFNISSRTATGTTEITAAGITPNSDGHTLFSTFIFAPENEKTLKDAITIKLTKTGGEEETKTIPGDQISLDSNVKYNAEADFAAGGDEVTVDVEVDIDSSYPDPNALKIGQFVNKDGSVTDEYNEVNTIGIIFAVGAKGNDVLSNYGAEFEGKTIAGYAMAVTCIGRTQNSTEFTVVPTGDAPYVAADYNGYKYTEALLACEGAKDYNLFNQFLKLYVSKETWEEKNQFTGTNLSDWYIPSARQLLDMVGGIMGYTDADGNLSVTKNADLVTAYESTLTDPNDQGYGWTNGTELTNFMSSYMSTASVHCVKINADGKSVSELVTPRQTKTPLALRPVLTVFKSEAAQ